ncbi:unnamed protein product, partial [Menidia menidia]
GYISGAVTRFLRSQPVEIISNDPNSSQTSPDDSRPPDPLAQADTSGGDADPHLSLAIVSQHRSSPTVAFWENCATDANVRPVEENKYLRRGSESKENEDNQGRREEQDGQVGNDGDAGLPLGAKIDPTGQGGIPESNNHENAESGSLMDDAPQKGLIEESNGECVTESESVSVATLDDHQKVDDTMTEIQVTDDDGEKDEEILEAEGSEVKLCTNSGFSPERLIKEEAGIQRGNTVQITQEEAEDCEAVLELLSEHKNKSEEETKAIENELLVCDKLSDMSKEELIMTEQALRDANDHVENLRAQVDIAEATNYPATCEQDRYSKAVTEGQQEENILTQLIICSEEAVESTGLHTSEFSDTEEDVVVTDMQTTTEFDVEEISDNENSVADQVEEEGLSSEVHNKGDSLEKNTSVTVNPKGETEEIGREFKNIPLPLIEGQLPLSQELNPQVCVETQGGVPEHNNELGPHENTTQWFLVAGNCEEIHITQLPEEVEDQDQESLKNSNTGADHLLGRQSWEERRHGTEERNFSFDLTEENQGGKEHLAQEIEEPSVAAEIQEPESSYSEEVTLLEHSMKTEIKHSDKEFETRDESAEEADKVAGDGQDGTEVAEFRKEEDSTVTAGDGNEPSRNVAVDEGVLITDGTLNFSEAQMERMTETSLCLESVHATSSLPDKITECEQSAETEAKLVEDHTVQIQDVGIDSEDYAYKEVEDDQMDDRNEGMPVQTAGEAAKFITGGIELSKHSETQETTNQCPDRAFEITTEIKMSTDDYVANIKDSPVISAEESGKRRTQSVESYAEDTSSSTRERLDVIDEDILDLWIETAMSDDTREVEQQEGSEPEPEKDTTVDLLKKEAGQVSQEDTLMESNSGESELVSDGETSSLALESGYMEQSFSEADLLKSTSCGSLDGMHDMVTMSEPATFSAFSAPNSKSQEAPMEVTAETVHSHFREKGEISQSKPYPDSGLSSPQASHLNQEFDHYQFKPNDESEQTKTVITAWKGTEGADDGRLVKSSPLFQFRQTKDDDESIEIIISSSSDEIKLIESERSTANSEGKGVNSDAFSLQVGSPVLDFTMQKSRIAVKSPHVRPPTNPRSLLQKPSMDPTPSSHVPAKGPAGVPLGGLGIGIKLPGLGAGFPVLKKTQRLVRGEDSNQTHSQVYLLLHPSP